ncbi:MAG TPA: TlpA disulfide reductase family protein [Acidobacteriota bacterium]|nr:TlpA disulfide reductase family protein [Acidobacteriota bacterium]
MKKPVLLALALLLAAPGLASCGGSDGEPSAVGSSSNQFAPNFTLPQLYGDPVTLSEVVAENKVVLVNFWATWCGPCRIELPHLNALHKKYGERGFTVLAINVDDGMAPVEEFLLENEFDFPVLRDGKFSVQRRYNVSSLPTNVFIDDRQEILRYMRGYTPFIEKSVEGALEYVEKRQAEAPTD